MSADTPAPAAENPPQLSLEEEYASLVEQVNKIDSDIAVMTDSEIQNVISAMDREKSIFISQCNVVNNKLATMKGELRSNVGRIDDNKYVLCPARCRS